MLCSLFCAKGRCGASSRAWKAPAAGSVGAILRAFKAAVTRRGRVEAGHLGPVWQRNYYEHIIRNDQEYLRARDYIARNAESWEIDKENPQQRR